MLKSLFKYFSGPSWTLLLGCIFLTFKNSNYHKISFLKVFLLLFATFCKQCDFFFWGLMWLTCHKYIFPHVTTLPSDKKSLHLHLHSSALVVLQTGPDLCEWSDYSKVADWTRKQARAAIERVLFHVDPPFHKDRTQGLHPEDGNILNISTCMSGKWIIYFTMFMKLTFQMTLIQLAQLK